MTKYIRGLILSYFKIKGIDYDLTELRAMLGYQQEEFDKVLINLSQEGYIAYEDFLIRITDKGILYLISNNQINFMIEQEKYNYINLKDDDLFPLDKPYVPKSFLKKI